MEPACSVSLSRLDGVGVGGTGVDVGGGTGVMGVMVGALILSMLLAITSINEVAV